MQRSIERLARLLGWPDRATATLAGTMYLFMSISFAALGYMIVRPRAAEMGPVRLYLFAVLLAAHTLLHWFGVRLTSREVRWTRGAYCIAQACLIVVISALVADQRLAMGLWATLLAETAALLWPEWRPTVLWAAVYVGLMALSAVLIWSWHEMVRALPTIGLVFGGILLYALLLVREGWTRLNAQVLVRQLREAQTRLEESAAQIEELTVSQERQRMAREMHDTLAQGLAGVILQLEAADAHLESGRPAEARTIVQRATERARLTLHEARRAIQALRVAALDDGNLAGALANEVSQFEASSGVAATYSVDGNPGLVSPEVSLNVLRILQECLSNVGRHAQARHVQVRLERRGADLRLCVHDDGKGFDVDWAAQRRDSFGLLGMRERAKRIGATLHIQSAPQSGTSVVLTWQSEPTDALASGPEAPLGTAEGILAQEQPAR